jgi:hypothetical protein
LTRTLLLPILMPRLAAVHLRPLRCGRQGATDLTFVSPGARPRMAGPKEEWLLPSSNASGARRVAGVMLAAFLLVLSAAGTSFAAADVIPGEKTSSALSSAPGDAETHSVPSTTTVEAPTPVSSGTSTQSETVLPGAAPPLPRSSATPSSGPTTTVPLEEEGIVESMHRSLSYGFLSSATWLDSFFGDRRYESESNESQFRVRFDAFRDANNGMIYHKPDYSLRLVLPQLRKMTRLEILGDPTTVEDPTRPQISPTEEPQTITSKNVAGTLQYFPVESNRSNFSVRAGVKLHYAKFSALIGPRYRYLIPLDPWALRFTQEVIWYTENKWQTFTTIDFERSLSGGLFFRTTLEGIWTEYQKGFPYSLSFVLAHPLDTNRALFYSWVNTFQTRPNNELLGELLIVGYRQRLWKPWLFLEIDPQASFPREKRFKYNPGILFRLEMVIGQSGSLF